MSALAHYNPVTTEHIEDHQMGRERFHIDESTAEAIIRTKQAGGRVMAVGTTVVRTLETMAQEKGEIVLMSGESRLFITSGFQFNAVGALMTNFHLTEDDVTDVGLCLRRHQTDSRSL